MQRKISTDRSDVCADSQHMDWAQRLRPFRYYAIQSMALLERSEDSDGAGVIGQLPGVIKLPVFSIPTMKYTGKDLVKDTLW
jgi:hypothetical protein